MKWIQKYHADFLNGEGLREVIFLSGCKHHCPNCFNPETWDFGVGTEWTDKDTCELIHELRKPYISGVTFTGGDPIYTLDKDILAEIYDIAHFYKKDIWVYTGFEWQELLLGKHFYLLEFIDVICDGCFVEELKQDNNKLFVGSSNQRIIDVKESLKKQSVVEICFRKSDNLNGRVFGSCNK